VLNMGLEVLNATHYTLPRPNRFPVALVPLPTLDSALRAAGNLESSSSCCYCGVPIGLHQALVEHWLSFEFFHHPGTALYHFVIRISPQTRFFRRPRFPLFGEMERIGAIMGNLGASTAARPHCRSGPSPNVALTMPGLRHAAVGDDNTEASTSVFGSEDRFVVMRTGPFRTSPTMEQLMRYTSDHKRLFLDDGWTAGHIWSLASGGSVANWQWMLWQPRILRKNAVLYFGSESKTIDELKRWTRLRWSRVVREKVDF
jgi:hypothetical protein